jgi:hypothetical protein
LPYAGDGLDGYITSTITKISKKSWYTITANPNVLIAQHEQIALDNCNAYLTPEVYTFPGDPTPEAGFRFYARNPLFLGSISLSKAPLADTEFNQIINGVGLKLKPGVEGVSVNYKVGIINDIYTDYPPVDVPSCEFIPSGNCQAEFNGFIANGNSSFFVSESECQNVLGVPCIPQIYVCQSDPTKTYTYYVSTAT